MSDPKFQLFAVTITTEIIVLAESEAEAVSLAKDESDIEFSECDYSAAPLSYLPGDWDVNAIPFGERLTESPDRTVGEWIKEGAAPEYTRRRKQLAEASVEKVEK